MELQRNATCGVSVLSFTVKINYRSALCYKLTLTFVLLAIFSVIVFHYVIEYVRLQKIETHLQEALGNYVSCKVSPSQTPYYVPKKSMNLPNG